MLEVVFKSEYLFCQERWDTSFYLEWIFRKDACDNNSWQICKQAIITLTLAYSFIVFGNCFSLVKI